MPPFLSLFKPVSHPSFQSIWQGKSQTWRCIGVRARDNVCDCLVNTHARVSLSLAESVRDYKPEREDNSSGRNLNHFRNPVSAPLHTARVVIQNLRFGARHHIYSYMRSARGGRKARDTHGGKEEGLDNSIFLALSRKIGKS